MACLSRAQIPVSQIEGYLELYHPQDTTSLYLGKNVGRSTNHSTYKYNTFLGTLSGYSNTTGHDNSFFGFHTGPVNTEGAYNSFFGQGAGRYNNTGNLNSFFGYLAGQFNESGSFNSFFGNLAGSINRTGSFNSFFGYGAGQEIKGSRNIAIGYSAGPETFGNVSDRLYIDVFQTRDPLIYGEFDNDLLAINGKLDIRPTGVSDIALRIDGDEALWYNGTYYSWGFGGDYNFFDDPVTINTFAVPGFDLAVNGTAAKTNGGSWSNLSDARLKNVSGNYEKGLDELIALQPVKFYYTKDNPYELDSETEQIGFIAQEVQKIFPEAVSEDSNGYLNFNMHALQVATVNALKELQSENDELRKENAEIKERLAKLEKWMAQNYSVGSN